MSTELQTLNNKTITIDSIEVAEMLGTSHSKIIRKLEGDKTHKGIIPVLEKCNSNIEDYFIESSYKDNSGKTNKCYTITLKGVKIIIDNFRFSKKIKRLIDFYNNNNLNNNEIKLIIPRDEINFLNKLEESLKPFKISGIRQYTVYINDSYYRIDYYVPSLKIAIEYDENNHKNYTYERQEGRQAYIENKLGCKFIRVSDENTDEYNIGLVIKKIFKITI